MRKKQKDGLEKKVVSKRPALCDKTNSLVMNPTPKKMISTEYGTENVTTRSGRIASRLSLTPNRSSLSKTVTPSSSKAKENVTKIESQRQSAKIVTPSIMEKCRKSPSKPNVFQTPKMGSNVTKLNNKNSVFSKPPQSSKLSDTEILNLLESDVIVPTPPNVIRSKDLRQHTLRTCLLNKSAFKRNAVPKVSTLDIQTSLHQRKSVQQPPHKEKQVAIVLDKIDEIDLSKYRVSNKEEIMSAIKKRVPIYRKADEDPDCEMSRPSQKLAQYEFNFDASKEPSKKRRHIIKKIKFLRPRNMIKPKPKIDLPPLDDNLRICNRAKSPENVTIDLSNNLIEISEAGDDHHCDTEIEHSDHEVTASDIRHDFDDLSVVKPRPDKPFVSPWRVNLPTSRRSTMFETKRNSYMPNYNQEPIIPMQYLPAESSINESVTNPSAHKKTPRQTTLHSYLNVTPVPNNELSKGMSINLFDDFDVSPPKTNVQQSNPDKIDNTFKKMNEITLGSSRREKENYFHISSRGIVTSSPNLQMRKSPRNILTANSVNITQNPSDSSEPTENTSDPNEKTNFGFISENENVSNTKPITAPVRISLGEIRKVFKKKVTVEAPAAVEEYVAEQPMGEPTNPANEVDENPPPDGEYVGLFEGNEFLSVKRNYGKCSKRKRRFDSCGSDEIEVRQPKKKNARTRKEELEAEKWAQQFNSLCDEVSNFELIIE